jgi:serine/threonine protein kinase
VKELKTETRRGLELSHPHIVRIYDFVDDEDTAAISMEFVDGKTLSELRLGVEGGVFTVAEVSKWLLGVCDALDYAHFQRKLVHRDLKPANIMLTARDDVAKIADFGIARSLSDTMSRLSVANMGASGTLPYMSPQQAMGERPLPTDDVYSLGATLYELFSGKPPFYRGDLPMQINSKIPPSIAERRGELDITARENLPQLWEQAIAACLSKDPNLRPSSAGTLAEMLGLKPSTATSQSLNFGSTQRIKNPAQSETPKKEPTPLPWIAAAATATFLAGGAAYYFGTQPETTKMPSSAVSFNSSPNSKSSELSKALASNAAKQSDAATTTTHAKPTAEKKPTHEEARSPLATSINAGAGVSMSTPVAKQDAPVAKQDAPVAKQDAPVAKQDAPTARHENAPTPSTGTMVAVVTPTQLAQTPPPQASSSQSNASAVGPNSPIAMEPSSTAVPAGVMSMQLLPLLSSCPYPLDTHLLLTYESKSSLSRVMSLSQLPDFGPQSRFFPRPPSPAIQLKEDAI